MQHVGWVGWWSLDEAGVLGNGHGAMRHVVREGKGERAESMVPGRPQLYLLQPTDTTLQFRGHHLRR